ncbi:MAG: DUF4340 domain-containing protein [Pseudobutyrivibrio sp.]|nr:DUF4340 domain-containing protein [Pseudobutyrivibrio sp.]
MKAFLEKWHKSIILILIVIVLMIFLIVTLLNINGSDTKEKTDTDNPTEEKVEKTHADLLDEYSTFDDDGEEIFLIPKDEITSFSMTDSHGILLNFELRDGQWVYVDDETLDIDENRIEAILNYLCDIKCIDTIKTDDASEYELSQDSKLYTLNDNAGNTIMISIGKIDQETGKVYLAFNYDFSTIFVNSGKLGKVTEYAVEELLAL